MKFDHVRLGLKLEFPINSSDPNLEKELASVDDVVRAVTGEGLAIIISVRLDDKDLAKVDLGNPNHVEDLSAFWQLFGRRASGANYPPDLVFFETVNEPEITSSDPTAGWNQAQRKLVDAIRQAAPQYTIIATGGGSGLEELFSLTPIPDSNVIYSFHYYRPPFTSRAEAMGHGKLKYPPDARSTKEAVESLPPGDASDRYQLSEYAFERWNKARIESEIGQVCDWANRVGQGHEQSRRCQGLVVICDEFGVDKRYAEDRDRVRWTKDVRVSLEKNGIGWTFWDYRDCRRNEQSAHSNFGLTDQGQHTPHTDLVKALGRRKP